MLFRSDWVPPNFHRVRFTSGLRSTASRRGATRQLHSGRIDVSHICGDSKTVFWSVFSVLEAQNRGFSIANRRVVCRISNPHCNLCRGFRFHISRNYWSKIDRMRPKIDRMRPFRVISRHFCVIWRHFCVTLRTSRIPTYVGSPAIV